MSYFGILGLEEQHSGRRFCVFLPNRRRSQTCHFLTPDVATEDSPGRLSFPWIEQKSHSQHQVSLIPLERRIFESSGRNKGLLLLHQDWDSPFYQEVQRKGGRISKRNPGIASFPVQETALYLQALFSLTPKFQMGQQNQKKRPGYSMWLRPDSLFIPKDLGLTPFLRDWEAGGHW